MKDDKSPYVRIAELEEENRQLRALLKPELRRPDAWGLTRMEHDALRAIYGGGGGVVSKKRIETALYGRRCPDPVCLRCHLANLRRKMKPYGVLIHLKWSQGYFLDADGLRIVREAAI